MVQLRGDRGRSDRLWHFLVAFRQLLKLGRFEIMRRHWENDVRFVYENRPLYMYLPLATTALFP